MKYTLRNFQNNYQAASSIGWVMIIIAIVFFFVKGAPAVLVVGAIGGLLIFLQYRGKRVTVDTKDQVMTSGFRKIELKNPQQIYVNKVRIAQNVNSRVSSANVKYVFYKAFLQDGEEKHLISCNRKEDRDMESLNAIAKDLTIPLNVNY